MRIYTRRGDDGTTGIRGGARVPKTDIRIEANGALDELNSLIGIARSLNVDEYKDDLLRGIQMNLMSLMSCVATPAANRAENPRRLAKDSVEKLEQELDRITAKGCMSQDFVLPGGSRLAGVLHYARSVCRRGERELWRLNEKDPVDKLMMSYVNRLSDLLFALARECNCDENVSNEKWMPFNRNIGR